MTSPAEESAIRAALDAEARALACVADFHRRALVLLFWGVVVGSALTTFVAWLLGWGPRDV